MPTFVVLEWNQASGRPSIAVDDLYDDLAEANTVAGELTRENRSNGRRERYTVHQVDMDEATA